MTSPLLISLLALAAASVDGGAGVEALTPVPLEFRGALVMPEEVYRAAIPLPEGAKADEATLRDVVERTEDFLHRAGYELAHVGGWVDGQRIVIDVSEGELEKIVFKGRLTFQMIRFKLAFLLPRDVFNRAEVQRQIRELSEHLDIAPPTWELVPTERMRHVGPQVEALPMFESIQGVALVKPQRQYELHLSFSRGDWTSGTGLDVRVSYFDGLELGLNRQGQGLLFWDDRWRVAAMGGVGVRQDLERNELYLFPSRAFVEGQYFTPELGRYVRSFLWLTGEGLARQRKDAGLRLENATSGDVKLSLNVQVQPSETWRLYVGMGFQLFGLTGYAAPKGEPPPPYRPELRLRGFTQLGVSLFLGTPPDGRWDRRHALDVDTKLWGNLTRLDTANMWELHAHYQKVFTFGWHDLWLRARGDVVRGDVLFPFEVPLGEHLRGTFGDIFVRHVAGGRAEFRFSLTRDVYKLGVFVDAAGFGEVDRATGAETPRFGVAAGPGFHALVVGMFQLDLNVSFGQLTTGRFTTGVFASLLKAY